MACHTFAKPDDTLQMPVNSVKSDGNRGSWIAPDMYVVCSIAHERWLQNVTCDPALAGTSRSTQSIRSTSARLATMSATACTAACTGEQQSALGLGSLLLAPLFRVNLLIPLLSLFIVANIVFSFTSGAADHS